jgi:hypothetical protein
MVLSLKVRELTGAWNFTAFTCPVFVGGITCAMPVGRLFVLSASFKTHSQHRMRTLQISCPSCLPSPAASYGGVRVRTGASACLLGPVHVVILAPTAVNDPHLVCLCQIISITHRMRTRQCRCPSCWPFPVALSRWCVNAWRWWRCLLFSNRFIFAPQAVLDPFTPFVCLFRYISTGNAG